MSAQFRHVVTHVRPDFDAWLSYWLIVKFMPGARDAELIFVPAGTQWTERDDETVVHVDTGLGKFDQHGKCLVRSCSALLVAEALGIAEDPRLSALLELATVVDNAEEVEATSIVKQFRAYPAVFVDPKTRQPDWNVVKERVFQALDIVYDQESNREAARKEFEKGSRQRITLNGLRLVLLDDRPHLRGPAFEAGADVAVWFLPRGQNRFYVGVVANNRTLKLHLDYVAYCLRWWEANTAGITVENDDELYNHGTVGPAGKWFLHDSGNIILYGSNTHPLPENECTRLMRKRIEDIVFEALKQTDFTRL